MSANVVCSDLPIELSEVDIDTGGASGKSHMSSRYEYSNVQAPKL